jgi:hypothetical protein
VEIIRGLSSTLDYYELNSEFRVPVVVQSLFLGIITKILYRTKEITMFPYNQYAYGGRP